jgi:hypothetical protein
MLGLLRKRRSPHKQYATRGPLDFPVWHAAVLIASKKPNLLNTRKEFFMKNITFRDVKVCSPVESTFCLLDNTTPHPRKLLFIMISACNLIHADLLLGLFFDPEYRHVTPKRQLTYRGLHDIICKRTEHFLTTAVRTKNLTEFLWSFIHKYNNVSHWNRSLH